MQVRLLSAADFKPMNKFLHEAYQQALMALEKDEVPVGAVVVKDGSIIGRGFNQTITLTDPSAHAEIIAIRDASRSIGDWRLTGSEIYVTLEPCVMCVGAILLSRITKIYFGAYDPKDGACASRDNLSTRTIFGYRAEAVKLTDADECGQIIKDYFKGRRKKNEPCND